MTYYEVTELKFRYLLYRYFRSIYFPGFYLSLIIILLFTINLINMSSEYDPELLQELLPTYYKRLFPHQAFYRWLSYGLCNIIFYLILF